jgi:hypothetical protein
VNRFLLSVIFLLNPLTSFASDQTMSSNLLCEKTAIKLDLTNKELHSIPEEVFSQQHLQEAWFDSNHIKEISPKIAPS